jgi:hypothetical protein
MHQIRLMQRIAVSAMRMELGNRTGGTLFDK